MAETAYFWSVVGLLLASGLCHIAAPRLTERWMSRVPMVRAVGGLLLVLAIPCLVWRGWYFWTLSRPWPHPAFGDSVSRKARFERNRRAIHVGYTGASSSEEPS